MTATIDPDEATSGGKVESEADFGEPPAAIAARWHAELHEALQARKSWYEQVRKVLKRYLDERSPQLNEQQRKGRFNILWSNVNTLTPALYAKKPLPQVEREQKDADPAGRAAAQILERALHVKVDERFDEMMKRAVFDYCTAGQGQCWVRYDPTFGEDGEQISDEDVAADYVHWRDWLTNPARIWAPGSETRWVARQHFWTRAQMKAMGFKDWKTIPLNYNARAQPDTRNDKSGVDELFMKSACWEIWDSDKRYRLYINVDWPKGPLRAPDPDPHGHEDFFPCPRPLLATCTNDSTIPAPDYMMYQDQARQLDKLTQRLEAMVDSCRTTGVYDKSYPELARLPTAGDNKLFPVDNWERFAKANGFTGTIAMLPIDAIITAIGTLTEAKNAAKADLYEITGISDIIRGESDPRATATAENIKGQYAALRLRDRQAEVNRFGRDAINLMGEVIANKFQPEKLAEMAGVDFQAAQLAAMPRPTPQPMLPPQMANVQRLPPGMMSQGQMNTPQAMPPQGPMAPPQQAMPQ